MDSYLNNLSNAILKIFIFIFCMLYIIQISSEFSITEQQSLKLDIVKINEHKNKSFKGLDLTKTFANFVKKQSLCENFSSKQNLKSPGNLTCPKKGIVTVPQAGRLGNQIWEYISVWLVSKETGLKPFVPNCIKRRLQNLLENLNLPVIEDILHCPLSKVTRLKTLKNVSYEKLPHNIELILPHNVVTPELLAARFHYLRDVLTIKRSLLDASQKILCSSNEYLNYTARTFVGVHARRTDYLAYLKRKYKIIPQPKEFFHLAMEYFERKYPDIAFIFISDDPNWCLKEFGSRNNVYVPGKYRSTSPELDIAIMASCNHSILDYGTFGQWGALFSGGETIYFPINEGYSSDRLGANLDNWTALKDTFSNDNDTG